MDIKLKQEQSTREAQEAFEKDLDAYRQGLRLTMWRALTMLEGSVKQNIRSKSGLHVRSGALLNSILKEVVEEKGVITGKIGSYNVPYAAVHEFGHSFPARKVEPRNAKVLHWIHNGKHRFSMGHEIPAFKVPARPYLGPAVEENQDRILEKFGLLIEASFGTEK